MDKHSGDTMPTRGATGPSEIFSLNVAKKVGSSAWGIPGGTGAFHGSSDASLFCSSLPVLAHEKLNISDSEHYGQSVDDNLPILDKGHKEVEGQDPLGHVEISAIGNMLPDADELLAGITDDFDLSGLPSQLEDLDDNDLFGSGGGFEMDFEPQENLSLGISKISLSDEVHSNGIGHYAIPNGMGTVAGEHPYGEHPSRTLFVRNINSNVEDSELRSLFEQYGDIRTLYTACKHRGFVMISYYDIRAARTAMRSLQNKPLRRRKLDIHFSIPKDNPSEKDINQGTLVVFNLDPSVSNDDLRQIFGAYGEVKEIRETPHKRHHKFIEFYDVRAAEAALKALNRSDIAGKRIKLEPSRPGGARRNLMQQLNQELEQDETRTFRHQVGSPIGNSPPGNWAQFGSPVEHNALGSFSKSPGLNFASPMNTNHLPGLAAILSPHVSSSPKIAPIGKDLGRANNAKQIFASSGLSQGAAFQHSTSFPEQKINASPRPITTFGESNSSSSSIGTLSGPQFLWGSPTPYSEHSNTSAWSSSMGLPFTSSGQRQGFPYTSQHSSFLDSHQHHHVGSAPSGLPLDRHFSYFPESPETSLKSSVAFGSMNHSDGNILMNMGAHASLGVGIGLTGNTNEMSSPNFRMMSLPRHTSLFLGNGLYSGLGGTTTEGAERGRSRRLDNSGNQIDSKKLYQLDLDKIMSGEDTRTTLMIKNIPNKYTSKMLLAAIDENHKGSYDFLYLPIDFKNKCNVGYAFINMVSPSHIIPFYKAFNGKKWEKFNSEKVASLAYARIQGKGALVTHFQNSSLMNEDKRCRPILFHSEGQEIGDQEHFLSSNLNICIRQPDGSYSGDLMESPKGNSEEKLEKD
ncbi:protein MEI2-like 2 isoform X1 [Abrus precatorius]|uniref:Protein MEI2-like 2 isoform X1 n=1 Tax=Abrus precatorius TaxID=3816 RepID=A0A8B8JRA2_ABRPR|nr:protein MEI2-like 2 isoform X1 [Abrus precatorius]XP_027333822.1 protein MEI2-like 2 isoform X1 [Abrus precatorius]XP_027333823.1 protein MEI2-like 2 isoform X1 [Abrus precatorius]XP_027333824.1 protein MEI2-like 2 isoform X1 [Abrus precatorius]